MSDILYQMTIQVKDKCWDPEAFVWILKPYIVPDEGLTIEQEDDLSATAKFYSQIKPSQLRFGLRDAILLYEGMLYIDVLYRYPDELFHDRFVVHDDGNVTEYRTEVSYTEET